MIAILSVIVAGFLSANNSKIINDKAIETRSGDMGDIYEALQKYFIVNGRLPCPASLILTKTGTDTSYGNEVVTSGSCSGTGVYTSTSSTNLVYGMVPFKTIGLPSQAGEDAYQNKIIYVVDKRFANSTTFGTTTATGIITIKERSSSTLTNDALFVLMSSGANKSGAFDANSSSQNTPRSSDSDELNNDLPTTPTSFDNIFIISSSSSTSFDDIIFYKTKNDLIGDSKASSDALSLKAKCAATSETLYGTTINWPEGSYDQAVVSTTPCSGDYNCGVTYPTKKCGADGVWGSVIDECTSCCSLYTGQNFGSGSTYTGADMNSNSPGTVINLSCINSNYGSSIVTSGSRTTNTSFDCGETAAGGSAYYTSSNGYRSTNTPYITCDPTTKSWIRSNGCVSCQSCEYSINFILINGTTSIDADVCGDDGDFKFGQSSSFGTEYCTTGVVPRCGNSYNSGAYPLNNQDLTNCYAISSNLTTCDESQFPTISAGTRVNTSSSSNVLSHNSSMACIGRYHNESSGCSINQARGMVKYTCVDGVAFAKSICKWSYD